MKKINRNNKVEKEAKGEVSNLLHLKLYGKSENSNNDIEVGTKSYLFYYSFNEEISENPDNKEYNMIISKNRHEIRTALSNNDMAEVYFKIAE